MKFNNWLFAFLTIALLAGFTACQDSGSEDSTALSPTTTKDKSSFVWSTEKFSDKRMIRYQVPSFKNLSLQQKKLVYYLSQAGLAGRDIMYDQNYRHNLEIRKALDNIVKSYSGDKSSSDWNNFMTYTKNVWFSNGIHHHYSMDKFNPEFSKDYFESLLNATSQNVSAEASKAIFDPTFDNKKVNLDPDKGLLKGSAVNFYDPDITEAEVDAFYGKMIDKNDKKPISYGLNSKLVRNSDGSLSEKVYKQGGLYGAAIDQIISWLEKAVTVAENEEQGKALQLLVNYYKTGDLKIWDDYNIAWVEATKGDVDYINSFIEVYNDPKGYRGSFESIVEIKDFDASERMQAVAKEAQWFEDNSTIMEKHKKANVVGVSYKVVNVMTEAGDASPASPIGVNLPNANWIRAQHGSKSVSLGNLIEAYDNASGPGILSEFAHDQEEIARAKKHAKLGDKMATALHEVIGHASGKIEEGVGTPKQTLKSYASTLEEARADLVALYYITDPKMIELGLLPSEEVGKAEYDGYIRNGLMTQLRRIEPGKVIEESHMRNRQMIAAWAFEKGQKENVISKLKKGDKTYFEINDYGKLRTLFGELLREVQRVKSAGDYQAGKDLIENYGVQVDAAIHKEVLARSEKLDIPPYGGFINPRLVPVTDSNGEITDMRIEYPDDFTEQMLEYADQYSHLTPEELKN